MLTLTPARSSHMEEQRAAAKAEIYATLAACCEPPTPALLAAAMSGAIGETLSLALSVLPLTWERIGPALRDFEALPARIHATTPEAASGAALAEYTRLLLGLGPAPASLHQLGDIERVRSFAAELELIALLADEEARAHATGDGTAATRAAHVRRALVADRLRPWAPRVAREILTQAHHPLYVATGMLLQAVIEADR